MIGTLRKNGDLRIFVRRCKWDGTETRVSGDRLVIVRLHATASREYRRRGEREEHISGNRAIWPSVARGCPPPRTAHRFADPPQ